MSLSLLATTSIPSATSGNPLRRTNTRPPLQVGKRVAYTSCEQRQGKEGDNHGIDRRNVLLGLGGLYGATASIGSQGMMAVGAPVQPPDLSACHLATDDGIKDKPIKVKCCPPYTTAKVVDFEPPRYREPLRVRKPAHKLNPDEVEKFKAAIRAMKNIKDPNDPWHYMQQATIHCTYCNGAYDQVGVDPKVLLQVHGSWLFAPWHRYYLYFWERILGKLIGDPTFAIPFWNWDTPQGMYIPKMYLDTTSPLYDDTRDKRHHSSVLDYNYEYKDSNPTTPAQIDEVITSNLCELRSIYLETLGRPDLFVGKPVRAGEKVPEEAFGRLENLHNVMHQWVGPPTEPYYNMGNFYTAARDTLFFGHHANVDRMWDIYSSKRGNRPEFKDPDYLNASFIFYDENRQVVKVKVSDCLTPQQLRYTYTSEKLPWMDIGRKCNKMRAAKKRSAGESVSLVPVSEFGSEPRLLSEPIRVLVQRPKISRSKTEKEEATEVLLIEGIQVPHGLAARFNVYVTKTIEGLVGPDYGNLAGSFVKIPHTHHTSDTTAQMARLELGINILLEDIEAEGAEKVVVTLVPRSGDVTVGGVRIELQETDGGEE